MASIPMSTEVDGVKAKKIGTPTNVLLRKHGGQCVMDLDKPTTKQKTYNRFESAAVFKSTKNKIIKANPSFAIVCYRIGYNNKEFIHHTVS